MRVLHVLSGIDARSGGPAEVIRGFAPAQKRCGLDVAVVATFTAGESDSTGVELAAQGIPVTRIGPASPRLRRHPQIVPKLRELIAGADVVHIHAMWEEIQHQAAVIACKLGKPYIIRPCGMLDPWSLSQGWLKKKIYMLLRTRRNLNRASAVHFTAELERDRAASLNLAAAKIVEPNGLVLSEFDNLPPKGVFRAMYPQLSDRLFALFLSRIHRKKGLDLLIPAFAKARQNGAMLVIAGPDDAGYQAEIEKLVDQHGIRNDVLFTGMLKGEGRMAALHDADLFVLPSYQENFGVAVVEALAAGCPVIISDQVNIYREIAAGGVGAVVPTQVEPLARELSRWISDEPLRRLTASRASAFARERYDWAKIARRWVDLYRGIAG